MRLPVLLSVMSVCIAAVGQATMPVGGTADLNRFMAAGSKSPAEVDALEASLVSQPDDRGAHLDLMGYYWNKVFFSGQASFRHRMVMESDWFAVHEPGSAALEQMIGFGNFSLAPADFAPPNEVDLARLRTDWRAAVASHANDATVIRHALAIMQSVDSGLARFCLIRLRVLMPTYPQYAVVLASLYLGAIAAEWNQAGWQPGSNPSGAYEMLLRSGDSAVIGLTGQMSVLAEKSASAPAETKVAYGIALLKKAHDLDATNPRWVAALDPPKAPDLMSEILVFDQLRQEDLWPNGNVPPMPEPVGTIKVDAEAQSLKRTLPGAAFLENVLTRPEGPAEVRLRVVVDSDGKVAQMRFESGSVKFFPTAMKIVGGFHYASTLSGGKPVAVETIVDLKFAKGSPRPAGVAGMAGMTGLSPSAEGAPTVFVTPPPGNAPVRISGGILAGMILEKTAPVYPAVARAAHVSGAVVLHAIIAKDGTVKELQVISGPDMLKSAAVDAVKTWRYRPYLLNGNPTEVDTTITVNFNFGAPAPSAAPPPGPEKPQ